MISGASNGAPPPSPGQFCRTVQEWLTSTRPANLAPPLAAANSLLERLSPSPAVDAIVFERQLLRLASREAPLSDARDASGAQALLELWDATKNGLLTSS